MKTEENRHESLTLSFSPQVVAALRRMAYVRHNENHRPWTLSGIISEALMPVLAMHESDLQTPHIAPPRPPNANKKPRPGTPGSSGTVISYRLSLRMQERIARQVTALGVVGHGHKYVRSWIIAGVVRGSLCFCLEPKSEPYAQADKKSEDFHVIPTHHPIPEDSSLALLRRYAQDPTDITRESFGYLSEPGHPRAKQTSMAIGREYLRLFDLQYHVAPVAPGNDTRSNKNYFRRMALDDVITVAMDDFNHGIMTPAARVLRGELDAFGRPLVLKDTGKQHCIDVRDTLKSSTATADIPRQIPIEQQFPNGPPEGLVLPPTDEEVRDSWGSPHTPVTHTPSATPSSTPSANDTTPSLEELLS